ncbi:hypothetical protein V6Z11_D06G150200 [Gossypium hirsutum]
MLLCQQKGIVHRDDKEVLENKGPINEASIERMTCGKDMPTINEAETNKTRKGKTKTESKGTNLTAETSLLPKMKDIEKLANSIRNKQIKLYKPFSEEDDLGDRDRSVESPPIVHVSDVEKEDDSRDIEECTRRIDILVEDDVIDSQGASAVEEEVDVEEDVHVEVVNEKVEKKNTETEVTEKESVEDIVNASEFVGATNDNLEQDGARPLEAVEVTSKEHHNSLAIVVYIEPLKVTPLTQEAVDDVRAAPKTKKQSEDRAKPTEKKRK